MSKQKKILSLKITDGRSSHDAQHLPSLAEQAGKNGSKTVRVLADGAYDSKDSFSCCCYDKEMLPAIRVRKTSPIRTDCCPRRKSVLAQLYDLDLRKLGVSYGDRRVAESVFSSFKRFFGEHAMAHKYSSMARELELKVVLYNLFASVWLNKCFTSVNCKKNYLVVQHSIKKEKGVWVAVLPFSKPFCRSQSRSACG